MEENDEYYTVQEEFVPCKDIVENRNFLHSFNYSLIYEGGDEPETEDLLGDGSLIRALNNEAKVYSL